MFGFLAKLFRTNSTPTVKVEMTTEMRMTPKVAESSIDEQVREQRRVNQENKLILTRVEKALASYPFIHENKIKEMAKGIVYGFKGDKVLSLQEKKDLGLASRRKYEKQMISCFALTHFEFDPNDFCKKLLYTERSIVWALAELKKLRKHKFVKKVKVEGYGTWDNKTYSIDNVPDIVAPDYTKEGPPILFFVMSKIS